MRYEVKKLETGFKVLDTVSKKWMTKDCPEEIANEICNDFNAMDNKDFSPLGLPDFSKNKGTQRSPFGL